MANIVIRDTLYFAYAITVLHDGYPMLSYETPGAKGMQTARDKRSPPPWTGFWPF